MTKKASVGLVFDVVADVLRAGAHAPPGVKLPLASALQFVLTNSAPKLFVPMGTRPS